MAYFSDFTYLDPYHPHRHLFPNTPVITVKELIFLIT